MAHTLLTSQQNDVFRAIQEAGLDPRDFRWSAAAGFYSGYEAPMLTAKGQGGFSFDIDDERHVFMRTPGLDRPVDEGVAGNWGRQLDAFKEWLAILKREGAMPNLWEELTRERELQAGEPVDVENTLFNVEEQAQIARQLAEIKDYVRRTHQLSEAEFAAIESRLDYMGEAAKRLGRLDWREAFLGAFLGAVVQGVLTPEVVRDVFAIGLRALGGLFGVEVPELPSGGTFV